MQPVRLVWDECGTSMGPVLDQYWTNIRAVQGSMGPIETKTSKYRIFMGLVLGHYGPVQENMGQHRTKI